MGKTIAQLNVEIAAFIKPLQDGLKSAERELRKSGQKLSSIGAEISTGLSIPLGLAGVGAIKAAGDIESLTLALKSQLGSAEAARKEFGLLTEAAKNPGLGVEQAVRGSVRLQGVKFSAEEARDVLIQMGNAIASTGGTAENLDSVTRQFSQMASKGRVLQEDISILAENMPAISGLMEKAFGTTNVEAIRAMGVSGKEFVLQISKAAEELPRVEGGIKNSIGNAMDSLKQSAAKVGLAINDAFDVTGAAEKFATFLQSVAESFSSLSPEVQKTILAFAGLAVAIGPILKIVGAVQLLRAQAVSAFEGIVSGAKALAGGVLNAAKAFQALSAAQKATVIGAAIAAVTALYFAYDEYVNSLTDAEAAQKAVNDVKRDAIASTEVEKAKIGNLVAVLEDNTRSLKDKQGALKQLKAISPAYFGDLDIEKGKVLGLTTAVDAYVKSLERQAIVKEATEQIAKLQTDLKNIGESGAPTVLQQTGNALKAIGTNLLGGIATIGRTKETFDNLNNAAQTFNQLDLQSQIQAKIDSFRALIKENIDLTAATTATTETTRKYSGATKEAGKEAKTLAEVISDIKNASETAKLLGDDEDIAKLEALRKGIETLIDAGFKPASKEVQDLKSQLDALTEKPKDIVIDVIQKEGSAVGELFGGRGLIQQALPTIKGPDSSGATRLAQEKADEEFQKKESLAEQWRDAYLDIAQQAADGFAEIFNNTADAKMQRDLADLEEEKKVRLAAAKGNASLTAAIEADLDKKREALEKKAGNRKKLLALAEAAINTAVGITKAIPNIPLMVAAAAAGAIQIGVIASQKFAAGTRDAPGGLALVGERGPELVNLPRHSQVFSAGVTATALRGGGQNLHISGEFRVAGSDLVLVVDRERARSERFR